MSIQENGLISIDGSMYKVGLRGLVFRKCKSGFVRSTKEISEIQDKWINDFVRRYIKLNPCNTSALVGTSDELRKARNKHNNAMKKECEPMHSKHIDDGTWQLINAEECAENENE